MLHAAAAGARTVRILSDDTDVFVLMVNWCWKGCLTCQIQMERWDGSVLSVNATVDQLGEKCKGILSMHVLSGCDTTSYPHGKGKTTALKVLLDNDIPGLDTVIGEGDATQQDLMETGTAFFLAIYGVKECKSIDDARRHLFCKRKTPPLLKSLPPTSGNVALHI